MAGCGARGHTTRGSPPAAERGHERPPPLTGEPSSLRWGRDGPSRRQVVVRYRFSPMPPSRQPSLARIVVDKFGGSVLRRPDDIAAAVLVVAEQRRAGLRPVVVVSAFEGVPDTILSSARVLLPDGERALREPRQA